LKNSGQELLRSAIQFVLKCNSSTFADRMNFACPSCFHRPKFATTSVKKQTGYGINTHPPRKQIGGDGADKSEDWSDFPNSPQQKSFHEGSKNLSDCIGNSVSSAELRDEKRNDKANHRMSGKIAKQKSRKTLGEGSTSGSEQCQIKWTFQNKSPQKDRQIYRQGNFWNFSIGLKNLQTRITESGRLNPIGQ
jgi:hypothetical protein